MMRLPVPDPILRTAVLAAAALSLLLPAPAAGQEQVPALDVIVARMMEQKVRQEQMLREFQSLRRFHAGNLRFKVEATMEVETLFRRAEPLESKVVRHSGSDLIRSRVFNKILEAERETSGRKEKEKVDITPANYDFSYVAAEDVLGRRAYRLSIAPKRKTQYSIRGTIWVDAEDFAISRISGSPSKRPSFWTLRTTIDRTYQRVQQLWLPKRLESVSDVFVAGRSTLAIECEYPRISTEPQ